jgi:hypothetical protein
MGGYVGPREPRIDVGLNTDNSVQFDLNYFPGADNYKIKVDGFLGLTTTTTVGVVTISPGLTRNLTIEAYYGESLLYSANKNIKIFDYVGAGVSWTTPNDIKFLFSDVQGAQGGSAGGKGGRVRCYIDSSPRETLYFYCGGVGEDSVSTGCTTIDPGYKSGGFNGGGGGGGKSDAYVCVINSLPDQTIYSRGASGGGASDIRKTFGDLNSRIIVAGGGGGTYGSDGGNGGGQDGADGGYSIGGPWTTTVRGGGATISSPGVGGTSGAGGDYDGQSGSLGFGGTGARFTQFGDNGGVPGGGGGGYYGGGGGGAGSNFGAGGGGGGGSGYIRPDSKSLLTKYGFGEISQGYREGNGRILVSWDSNTPHSDIVTDGLVLNLDAQNYYSYPGSGTTWTDLSGNGNNGTLVNGVGYDNGNGGSLVFDGVDDYISYSSLLNVGNTFTLNFWIKATTKTRQTIFSNGYPFSTNKGFFMCCPGNNSTDMFLSLGQDQKIATSSTGTITSNVPQMITAVANGSSSLIKFYSNGVEISSYSSQTDANITLQYDTGVFVTGKRDTTSADTLNSNVYNLQIYNRALTASEIQQNFNATRSSYGI